MSLTPNTITKIFLDVDETLLHTIIAYDVAHAEELIDRYSEYWPYKTNMFDGSILISFLRPIAHDLIDYCRELVGSNNTYLLSFGTRPYIRKLNSDFGFRFEEDHFYAREDIRYKVGSDLFKSTRNVLVDNETFDFHANVERNNGFGKLSYLSGLKTKNFLNIKPFTVWGTEYSYDNDFFKTIMESLRRKGQIGTRVNGNKMFLKTKNNPA